MQNLDAEISKDSENKEAEEDGKEKEKMLFSIIFAANDERLKEEKYLDNITDNNSKKKGRKSEDQNQRKRARNLRMKIKIMKQIAFVLNPLAYVLYSVFYFLYYLNFF